MNISRTCYYVAAVTAFSSLSARPCIAGGIIDLFSTPDLETIVITDATPAGRLARMPTPGHPVTYVAISAGLHEFGGIVAGEKPMPRDLMNKTVMKVLAKQGYLPAGADQHPDIIVMWTWGTLNTYRIYNEFGGGLMSVQVNEPQMRWFLGGAKLHVTYRDDDPFHSGGNSAVLSSMMIDNPFPEYTLAPELWPISGPAQVLIDTAKQDLYVAVVSAYKPDLDASKRAQLLWQTRISAPARGFWMPEALPAMLVIAGPFFGRDMPKPVWIRASDRFKPDVQIGDLRVLEYIEQSEKAVANVGRTK